MTSQRTNEIGDDQIAALTDAMEAAGIYLAVEQRDGALILSGEVDSVEMRDAALDLAQAVAEGRGVEIEDAIEVLEIDVEGSTVEHEKIGDGGASGEPSTLTDVGTIDPGMAMDEGIPYFPPTDPVIGEQLIRQDEVEVIGGFQPTSLEEEIVGADAGVGGRGRGDDQIAEDIIRELREDGATTDLVIGVAVRNGVAVLRGEVASLEDAENAEAVAGRVDGVSEVREELQIAGPRADRHG